MLALVSLGLGLLSFASIICCCIPVLNWAALVAMLILGLGAIVTGGIALVQARSIGTGRTEAIAGIILGSIWMAAAVGAVVVSFLGCASLGALGAIAGSGVEEPGGPPVDFAPAIDEDDSTGPPEEWADGEAQAGGEPAGEPGTTPTGDRLDALCAPASFSASRSLTVSRRESYPVEAAFDGRNETCWAVRDAVPGEDWIELRFAPGTHVSRVWLTTGFERVHPRTGDLFPLNAHVRRLSMVTDAGRRSFDVGATDRSLEIDVDQVTSSVRLVIDEVWPGERWQDLSISEIQVHCAR